MKIAIMGSGGVGGFYGGRLARGGEDVTFIARGAHLEAMRKNGLQIESPTAGDFKLAEVQATDNPAEAGVVDLVLVSVKTYGLEEAARAIVPMIGPETTVLPLLNGVDITGRLGAIGGEKHVIGGTVYVAANIAAPGTIRHLTMDRLIFGELEGGTSPRCEAIQEAFTAAGIEADHSSDIKMEIWRKFVGLIAISGVASVTRLPGKAVADDADTRDLLGMAMGEVVRLARSQGIGLDENLPEQLVPMFDSWPPEAKPSMLVALEAGSRLELESLQGTVVRMAEAAGVPTPVNRFIYTALKAFVNGPPSAS
ncbi:MAG: 2-dehydropantoate 2-reductase [bacterium]